MAQYLGKVKGSRGQGFQRIGNKATGLTTECNGWDIGVKVVAEYDELQERDVMRIYMTSGSGGRYKTIEIAKVEDMECGRIVSWYDRGNYLASKTDLPETPKATGDCIGVGIDAK